jgi:hypothetical protein
MKAALVRYKTASGSYLVQSVWDLEDGRRILHSSVCNWMADENMTFPCTKTGKVKDWWGIDCIRPHNHDHAAAMRQMGYEVTP